MVSFFIAIFVLTKRNNIMEAITTFIGKALWAVIGGTISIAFIGGILGAFGYSAYYICRYGYKKFAAEFLPR